MGLRRAQQVFGFRNWYALLFISIYLFGFSGCRTQSEDSEYTIAFSQCTGSDAWRETMYAEMLRELSFHPNVKLVYYDAKGDNNTQIKQVKEVLNQAVDLLIISPNEAEPLTPIVDEVFQQGIPVVVTDRKTSSGLYNAYVGANNYDIGYLAGVYLGRKLDGHGTIAEITGLPGASASIERQQGFRKALQHYPLLKVTTSLNGQWLRSVASKEVSDQRNDMLDADAIFAFNDQMAFGAYQALQETNPDHSIKIIGVDALPGEGNGLNQVANGVFNASMVYPTGGKEAIRTALAILNRQPYERENILNTMVIDSTNVQLMKMQADKISSQQADIDKQQALITEQKQIYHNQRTVLNIVVVSLVLAIVFGGIVFYLLKANWDKNKRLETQNEAILNQQEALVKLNDQLKEATDAKMNFFTHISHEFKTPLTLILAPVEDLITAKDTPSSVKDQLQLVRKNSLQLMKLVSRLIDLRRVGYEKLRMKAHPQDMLSFLKRIVQSLKPLSFHKNISISLENTSGNEPIWFDDDLMEKVFYNLLSNALKHTSDSGRIRISLANNPTNDLLLICVTDNGCGIRAADLPYIFDPFFQSEYSTDGSGIGLAIVKDVMALHHGKISVTSTESEGTSFALELPLGHAHISETEKTSAPSTLPTNVLAEIDKTLADLVQVPSEANYPKEGDLPLYEHSVLIVDDNNDIVHFLTLVFRDTYTVYHAANVNDAMAIIQNQLPDVVLTDLVMPGKTGLDLLNLVKQDCRISHIPVLLLTAHHEVTKKTAVINALADMYITKPFNTQHLKAAIRNLLANRKMLQSKYSSQPVEFLQSATPKLSIADKRFLNGLSAIVEANLANSRFGVNDICKPLGVSRVQLYRKVKALLECTVNDYITTKRLTKAKFLLRQDKNVNEVADETGFASATYFATAFRKKYGVSPSNFKTEFRRL